MVQGDMQGARANTNNQADDAIGRAMQGLGQQGMGLASTLMRVDVQQAKEAEKKAEDAASVQVSNILSQGDVYWQENVTKATQGWTVGGPDLRETIGKEFDTWATQNTEKLPTDASKKYFQQHAAGMKSRLQTGVFTYQQKATTAKLDADTSAGMQADENVVFNDPKRLDEIYRRRMEPMIARSDLTEADKITAATKYKAQLSMAVERGQMERDPAGWYRDRFGEFKVAGAAGATKARAAGGGFDAVMADVFRHEGGYNAKDGGNGAPVNFGINQGHNPDIDVKNLTKAEAAKLYKTRYWDKIGGDNLPPELQGTAMDAAVNQGPANAKKWIDASGGDPVKFNALRRAHYEKLLEDPKNAKYRGTWMRRMAEAETGRSGTAAAPGAPPGDGARYAGQADVTQPATFSGLDYEKQIQMKNHAEMLLKQAESTFKASADRAVSDAVAMHKDGMVDPQELQPEFFARAYGPDAVRMHDEYMASREMGEDIGKFKTQSEGEIAAEVRASEPTPGAGYASADARRNIRVQAAHQVLQARKDDPAGYAVKTNESLSRQRAVIDNPQTPAEQRPGLVQQFVRESLAEQQRLGIQSPQVLTPAQADAIAKRAISSQKPEDSANLIAGLEAEYGGFFPKVFGELVKAGKISGELLLIPNLPSQSSRETVSRLARVKEADLAQGIDAAGQKDVKDQITDKMGEFAKAVPMMSEQAAGVVNAYEGSMRKIAYSFMVGGASPKDAVSQAHKMLLGHYQFDETMRVPASVDLSATKRGAKHMLDKDMVGIDVPADLVGARTPEARAAEWQDTVKSRPVWFASDDDRGLTLYAQGADGVRRRVTRGGNPVTYSWADLAGRVSKGGGRQASGSVTYPGTK